MIIPERTAQKFLEGLSNDSNGTIESLKQLIEDLENKKDPDPVEMRLLENLYHFIEGLKILENNVRSYVKDSRQNLVGTKLTSLYENVAFSVFSD